MKFTILVDPSLVFITIHLVCIHDLCLGVEKKIVEEIMQFHPMTYDHALAQKPLPQGS